jgi:NADPH-dependent glutamate synthase beta subunit-like oxidoreductase/NAD-dependent dihydropyrimidine dehydrogenase PreA subunit
MSQLDKTFPTNDCSMCIISPKLVEAGRHLNIDLYDHDRPVQSVTGEAGNFTATLRQRPRFIDMDVCTACGECSKVCPIDVPNDFDQGLRNRKAAFKRYPQAMPSAYTIEKKGTAPCKAACPANPSFQGCVALMAQGKYKEAFELFRSEHPFPGICGRICHHPCETACTRGQVDAPVSIMALHRFLADWARENGVTVIPEEKVKPGRESGRGGQRAGRPDLRQWFLAIEGFSVTVFEKHDILGGMLTLGIPAYRLPRDIIDEEIAVLRELGVAFETGVDLGADVTVGQLRDQGYGALLHGHRLPGVQAAGHRGRRAYEGVWPGVDYLLRTNLGEQIDLGDRVAVIGGGNVAMDAVRTALRSGSKAPFIIYRRSEAEMPANAEEIAECREEGIEIMTLTNPVRVVEENGRVTAIECIRMQLGEPDDSGRRRPEPVAGSEFTIAVDAVVPAIGQESDWACLTDECACTLSDWGTMNVDPVTLQSQRCGHLCRRRRRHRPQNRGRSHCRRQNRRRVHPAFSQRRRPEGGPATIAGPGGGCGSFHGRAHRPPGHAHGRPRGKKNLTFEEVQLGLDEAAVQKEVRRCLACGICSECYQCVSACLAGRSATK